MSIARKIILVVALSLAGCVAQPQITLPTPYTQQGVNIAVDGLWEDTSGNVAGISGIATNVSGRDLTLVQITFDVLDATGVKVTGAVAVTNGLKAAQKWRFQATFMNPFSVNFTTIVPGETAVIPASENPQPQPNAVKFKSIMTQFVACMSALRAERGAETLWRHSPMSAADAAPAQLSDPSFATDPEISLIRVYNAKVKTCQQDMLKALSSAMPSLVPPISEVFAARADYVTRLEDRQITWGEFNTRLRNSALGFQAKMNALMR